MSAKRIKKIEKLPDQELMDVQTTSHTFVANGLVSHNSNFLD